MKTTLLLLAAIILTSFDHHSDDLEIIKKAVMAEIKSESFDIDSISFENISEISKMELTFLSSYRFDFIIKNSETRIAHLDKSILWDKEDISAQPKGTEKHTKADKQLATHEAQKKEAISELTLARQSMDSCLRQARDMSNRPGAGYLCSVFFRYKKSEGGMDSLRLKYIVTKDLQVQNCSSFADIFN